MGYVLFIRHTPNYRLPPAEDGADEGDDADADQEQRPERAHVKAEAEQGAKCGTEGHEAHRADRHQHQPAAVKVRAIAVQQAGENNTQPDKTGDEGPDVGPGFPAAGQGLPVKDAADAADDAAGDGKPASAGENCREQEDQPDADDEERPLHKPEQLGIQACNQEETAQKDEQDPPNNTISIFHQITSNNYLVDFTPTYA